MQITAVIIYRITQDTNSLPLLVFIYINLFRMMSPYDVMIITSIKKYSICVFVFDALVFLFQLISVVTKMDSLKKLFLFCSCMWCFALDALVDGDEVRYIVIAAVGCHLGHRLVCGQQGLFRVGDPHLV